MKVSRDQESFEGVAVFEVVDTAGVVVFSDTVLTAGTRQQPLEP
jgi:hypothetical protein